MTLWTHTQAEEATRGKAQGTWEASRVVIDSRAVQPGDLFVAIKGEKFDGHDFVADALAKGAVAAVVSQPGEGNLLVVQDTLKALEDLGKFARARSNAKIVGITGSVGKTSAKEMVKIALSAHGKTYATAGNLNNHIGTPLNLANLPPDVDFAVFEMGMNHAGEISHLARMVRPHVAAITNIEAVHLEFFDSIEGIALAKSEIFDGLNDSGVAVLPADSPYLSILRSEARKQGVNHILIFGEAAGADCKLLSYQPSHDGSKVKCHIAGRDLHFDLRAVGRHWATTALLALAVSHALSLEMQETARALVQFGEPDGRGRVSRIKIGHHAITLVDDSYNASPAAMRAAFAKTVDVWNNNGCKGRKIAVLGDMLELGESAVELHAGLAESLQAQGFDKVFTAGSLMKHLHDALPKEMRGAHVAAANDLLPILRKSLSANDVLLVKGSHGSKMYELVSNLRGDK